MPSAINFITGVDVAGAHVAENFGAASHDDDDEDGAGVRSPVSGRERSDLLTIRTYQDLSFEAKVLDRELFYVLQQGMITGPLRDVVHACPANSFVQAWFLIHEEKGNSNLRKRFEIFKGGTRMLCR